MSAITATEAQSTDGAVRIYTTTELREHGYHSRKLAKALRDRTLLRLIRGYYVDGNVSRRQALKALHQIRPEIVFTGFTALYLYGFQLPYDLTHDDAVMFEEDELSAQQLGGTDVGGTDVGGASTGGTVKRRRRKQVRGPQALRPTFPWPAAARAPRGCNATDDWFLKVRTSRVLPSRTLDDGIRVVPPVAAVADIVRQIPQLTSEFGTASTYSIPELKDRRRKRRFYRNGKRDKHREWKESTKHHTIRDRLKALVAQLKCFLIDHYSGLRGNENLEKDISRCSPRGINVIKQMLVKTEIGTSSGLEREVLRPLHQEGYRPRTNFRVGPYTYDLAFPKEKVLVEVDSWQYHHQEKPFIVDRWKSNAAARAGWLLLRFTCECIDLHLPEVLAEIRAALKERRTRSFLATDRINAVWMWHAAAG